MRGVSACPPGLLFRYQAGKELVYRSWPRRALIMQIVMHRFQVRRQTPILVKGAWVALPQSYSPGYGGILLKCGLAYIQGSGIGHRSVTRAPTWSPKKLPLITTTTITTFTCSQCAYLFLSASILHVVSESTGFLGRHTIIFLHLI